MCYCRCLLPEVSPTLMPPPRELLDSIALTDVACLVNSQDNDGAVVSRIRRKVVDFLLLQGGKSLDVRHQQ